MTYDYIKLWVMPSCYAGEVWPGYYSSGVWQSRDSDALERSNFACMLTALGGESETVLVVRESHWALGWVKWIAIHQDDETALAIADGIAGALAEYPVINEDHWSELEYWEAQEVWANCYSTSDRIAYIREHRSQFGFSDYAHMIGCVRGNYFTGHASELLN